MKILAFALIGLFTNFAFSAEKSWVLFFGGYGASPEQMSCWEKGARAQNSYASYIFQAVAYPEGSASDMASVLKAGELIVKKWADEINLHPERKYFIVGHSSGAALANRVAELVARPQQIELVDLDGFAASASLQKKAKTTCVYAVQTVTGMQSRNAISMKEACRLSHAYKDSKCQTPWCLHFSLVNTQVAPSLSGADFKKNGYLGCGTNLDWLKPDEPPGPASVPHGTKAPTSK